MKIQIKTLVLGVSLSLNALSIALVIGAVSANTATLSFYPKEAGITAAVIVSVPPDSTVTFNPVEITMRTGESAFLQIASAIDGRQANWLVQALYDRHVISTSPNASGVTITAVAAGECVMQTLTNDGIMDVAIIRVTE
ncbi:MAG: hypothetical protein FWC64_06470 [Treponema sp.]|nr:hypothetical protein [Treponema sp.]